MPVQPWHSTGNRSGFQLACFLFTLFHFLTVVRFDSRVFPFFAFSGFDGRAFFCGFPGARFSYFVRSPFGCFFRPLFGGFASPGRYFRRVGACARRRDRKRQAGHEDNREITHRP
jgi:hypothetical protein